MFKHVPYMKAEKKQNEITYKWEAFDKLVISIKWKDFT